MRRSSILLVGLVLATSAGACSSDGASEGSASVETALKTYAANLFAAYSDAVNDEAAFQTRVEALLASPSDATLAAARDGWLASREHYMLTEGARFYGGPIDAEPDDHEAALNSWPLDEAYVDYTTDKATGAVDETSGLVNRPDLLPDITAAALDARNAVGSDENVSNGYHAIELLLWGQALGAVGPAARPATDYAVGGPRKNADRRAAYLRAATDGVALHLTAVRDAWAPSAPYRASFEAGGMESVRLALTGLAKMSKGELAGQRMNAAYASKSRRDQHDCFSSLTLTDYERDARGVEAMYLGRYGATDGPGFDELVRAKDADLDDRLKKQLKASIDAIAAVPKPFEASLVGADDAPGRVAIRAAVSSLRAQADLLAEAAAALGVPIVVPEENP